MRCILSTRAYCQPLTMGIQTPTADLAWAKQLQSLNKKYHTLHVELGPRILHSSANCGPSLREAIVILTWGTLDFAGRIWDPDLEFNHQLRTKPGSGNYGPKGILHFACRVWATDPGFEHQLWT